ncbi:hypothetical protein HFO24_14860 [Rhizobium laguerreae]|uniref:hypothetical protein n=1 Tax=Rhizobium laguerreae TaxID=1076926 RepID=UPI001C924A79|nr:hypothetical protein [Rhizobium laguerreae]MBY3182934.1 hypothetical protein [Rhizobium laguerreae]
MTAFYHFHWTKEKAGDHLILVTTLPDFDEQDLITIVDEDKLSDRPYPDGLILIVPQDAAENARRSLSQMIQSSAKLRLADASIPVALLSFDAQGTVSMSEDGPLQGEIDLSKKDFSAIIDAGISHLVDRREAVLVAPPGHHFVHPRRRHSRAFLRTANMLIQGPEIGFLALKLLAFLEHGIDRIWIDSSSIASLVYAAYALKSRLLGRFLSPRVESFSSYDGFDQLSVLDPDKELVLISATATGSLPEKVLDRTKLPAKRVITLFSTVGDVPGTSLCLTANSRAVLDPLSLQVFEETDCPWCRDGSRTVTFVGDQFLADAATVSAYTLVGTDAPKALRSIMAKYRGHKAFHLKLTENREAHALHVNLDETLLATGPNREAIRTLVRRDVPASTTHIFAAKGGDSEAFAKIVAEEIVALGLAAPIPVSKSADETASPERRGVVVVAASIGSGQSLQDASRDLRKDFENLPRTFVAGLRKHSIADPGQVLLRNLEHNNDWPKHILRVVDDMMLPHPNQFAAWMKELDFWQKVIVDRQFARSKNGAVAQIRARMAVLSRDISDDNLFLRTSAGQPLKLRPSFAFWDEKYGNEIAQGDVFATIASILENCRKGSKDRKMSAPLAQSPFHVNVLSSENFTRFNDGIIQAALLRAAFPHELNFAGTATSTHSTKISHLIVKMMEHHRDDQGEACLEFLLALATKRLTLAANDLKRIAALPQNRLPDLMSIVLPYALGQTPKESLEESETEHPY